MLPVLSGALLLTAAGCASSPPPEAGTIVGEEPVSTIRSDYAITPGWEPEILGTVRRTAVDQLEYRGIATGRTTVLRPCVPQGPQPAGAGGAGRDLDFTGLGNDPAAVFTTATPTPPWLFYVGGPVVALDPVAACWQRLYGGDRLSFVHPRAVVVGGEHGVLYQLDGSGTWRSRGQLPADNLPVYAASPDGRWLATYKPPGKFGPPTRWHIFAADRPGVLYDTGIPSRQTLRWTLP